MSRAGPVSHVKAAAILSVLADRLLVEAAILASPGWLCFHWNCPAGLTASSPAPSPFAQVQLFSVL